MQKFKVVIFGVLFILSVFIAPSILSLFTASVTTAALVMVGILMFNQIKDITWHSNRLVASVFVTILMMILSYSISLGIAFGYITYHIGTVARGKIHELSLVEWTLFIVFGIYLVFRL